MRYLYTALIGILALPAALWLAHLGRQFNDDWRRWRERFGWIPLPDAPVEIWVHAVSVGEIRAASPLIEALLTRHGDLRVGVTCMTPSGSAQVRQLWGSRVYHCYLPLDLPQATRRFLLRLRPRQAVVFETELWPNLYRQLKALNIPLVIANARLSERSMKGYGRLGHLAQETLSACRTVAAQSTRDAQRFSQLGAPHVEEMGNIKFDITLPAEQLVAGITLRTAIGSNRPVWAAVSTHDGEESAALAAHETIVAQIPDAVLILVPRHPQRFDTVWQLLRKSDFHCARRSQADVDLQTQVMLGDSMGEMFTYLSATDIAFVGGSLAAIGGHNILEPAALGKAVVFGPHMANFLDARTLLLDSGGAISIEDASTLPKAILSLLNAPAERSHMGACAQAAVAANRGALTRLLEILDRHPPSRHGR